MGLIIYCDGNKIKLLIIEIKYKGRINWKCVWDRVCVFGVF